MRSMEDPNANKCPPYVTSEVRPAGAVGRRPPIRRGHFSSLCPSLTRAVRTQSRHAGSQECAPRALTIPMNGGGGGGGSKIGKAGMPLPPLPPLLLLGGSLFILPNKVHACCIVHTRTSQVKSARSFSPSKLSPFNIKTCGPCAPR